MMLLSRIGVIALILASTNIVQAATVGLESALAQNCTPRYLGYLPSYRAIPDSLPAMLTDLVYAFVLPKPNGELEAIPEPQKLDAIRQLATRSGVRLGILVGGWNEGDDSAFDQLAADVTLRERFISASLAMIEDYNLDGMDLDWEYPDAGSRLHFEKLITELADALHKQGKYLSVAVPAQGKHADNISAQALEKVDMINIMAYDNEGANHSGLELARESLDYWDLRGQPANKLNLGIPFYSRPTVASYAELVSSDWRNAFRDSDGVNNWNGIPTSRDKTRLALAGGNGIMVWELGQDTQDENSLAAAISDTIKLHTIKCENW